MDHAVRHALVLAAGEGTRLRPLTDRIPKPLLPIDGEPVIGRVLRQLAALGIERATIVAGYRSELVRRFVAANAHGLELTFVEQPERLGSGDAIRRALAAGMPREDSVLAAADTWWRDADVTALVSGARREPTAVATMALLRWPIAELPHRSATIVGADGSVVRVLEEIDAEATDADATALAGSPLYLLRAPIWSRFDGADGARRNLADALQAAIDDGEAVRAHEVEGARDLTRPDDLLRHNFPFLAPWLDEANAP